MLKDNLTNIRKSKKIKQDDVAAFLNIKRQTYSAYERGVSIPDAETLNKLAKFFDVDVNYLLGNDISNEIPLTENYGDFLIRDALKDTGLLNEKGYITEEGAKIISQFLKNNSDMLKSKIELIKKNKQSGS